MLTASDLRPLLQPWRRAPRWWLAYSGGLDSSVLLTLVSELCQSEPGWPALHAIHVDHGLHPDSGHWARACATRCQRLGIPLRVERVRVDADGGAGVEAAARAARYGVFEALLAPGDCLLQAHHADDRAETLLLHLLRGSGPRGLAAIPGQRPFASGHLLRPLLAWPRAALEAVARERGLAWVDDPSNRDTAFDRNWLRHRVMPRIAERWPAYREALARSARHAAEAEALQEELAALDAAAARRGAGLSIALLRGLSPPRRANLLRHWLRQQCLPPVPEQVLRGLDTVFAARADAQPCLQWSGASLRRFREVLYALPALPALSEAPAARGPWPWQPPQTLAIAAAGELRAHPCAGAGLRADLPLSVRLREGGERSRPQGRPHSQTLRRLLQEHGVEPWWRERLPLVYSGDVLVAVADYWVEADAVAGPGQAGWRIEWRRPGEDAARAVPGN